MGRFITEDPIKDGNNWYAYCANNPLTFIDPTGLVSYRPTGASQYAKNQISGSNRGSGNGSGNKDSWQRKNEISQKAEKDLHNQQIWKDYTEIAKDHIEKMKAIKEYGYERYIDGLVLGGIDSTEASPDISVTENPIATQVAETADVESSETALGAENTQIQVAASSEEAVNNIGVEGAILSQRVDGVTVYPNACKSFAAHNSVARSGARQRTGIENIHDFVNSMVGQPYTTALAETFLIKNVQYNSIPLGLTEEAFKSLVGQNPTLLSYPQNIFWGDITLTGSHGISYFNNEYNDPYMGRTGAFSQITSPRARGFIHFSDYNGGYYFTYENQ